VFIQLRIILSPDEGGAVRKERQKKKHVLYSNHISSLRDCSRIVLPMTFATSTRSSRHKKSLFKYNARARGKYYLRRARLSPRAPDDAVINHVRFKTHKQRFGIPSKYRTRCGRLRVTPGRTQSFKNATERWLPIIIMWRLVVYLRTFGTKTVRQQHIDQLSYHTMFRSHPTRVRCSTFLRPECYKSHRIVKRCSYRYRHMSVEPNHPRTVVLGALTADAVFISDDFPSV
jgi:hypothetical protein